MKAAVKRWNADENTPPPFQAIKKNVINVMNQQLKYTIL